MRIKGVPNVRQVFSFLHVLVYHRSAGFAWKMLHTAWSHLILSGGWQLFGSSLAQHYASMLEGFKLMHLLNLPVVLLSGVLTEWIDLVSLLSLDGACCSALSRKAYLDAVGSGEFCLRTIPADIFIDSEAVRWFVSRKAKLAKLLVDSSFDAEVGGFASLLHVIGASLVSVRFSGCELLCAPALGLLSFSSPRLRSVMIDDCGSVGIGSLSVLICRCAGTLKCLKLQKCEFSTPQSTNALPDLETLYINTCTIDVATLCKLISASPNLRYFNCDDLQGVDNCFDALAANCPVLEVLCYERANPHSTAALISVLHSCPLIHVVDISSEEDDLNGSTSDLHIAAIVQHCQKLKALRIPGRSAHVTDASLRSVAGRLRDLNHLALYNFSLQLDSPLLAIPVNWCNIRSLDLWGLGDDVSQMALVTLFSNLNIVVELDLDGCELSDAVLEAIGAHCLQLGILHLMGCTGFSGQGLVAIAQGCTALRELYIRGDASMLTPFAMQLWQVARPGLRFQNNDSFSFTTLWRTIMDVAAEEVVVP